MEDSREQLATDNRPWLFKYITAITRAWGILTVIVLWVFAVQSVAEKHKSYTKWYLIGISPAVTILECLWILNKIACCKNDGECFCKTWHFILKVDGWAKTLIYTAFSIPCFLKGIVNIWAVLYGLLLIILGLMYLLKSIKYSSCIENKRTFSPEDPRASLVNSNQEQSVSSPRNYSSTDATTSRNATPRNPDWPPPGYEEAPDGTLYKVSAKDEDGPTNTSSQHKKSSTAKSDDLSSTKTVLPKNVTAQRESDSFEPEVSREWPPPGFATAADGSIYEVGNEQRSSEQGRTNPFNKPPNRDRDFHTSTDSYNPFES